jgi:hypothetical protein
MGSSTFQEFLGGKGMYLCFCVSRKQASGHYLSPPSDCIIFVQFFFERNFFGKKETPMKNEENHMNEQNKSFQMVSLNQLGPLPKFWLWFVGRIGSYCFSYGFSLK